MAEITVTVAGPVGCGKSAIAGEIEIALRALGVPVQFADEKGRREEKNMTGADWTGYLDIYKPSVVIVEAISPAPSTKTQGDRKFCDFPECGCSMGAAERCGHPPAPQEHVGGYRPGDKVRVKDTGETGMVIRCPLVVQADEEDGTQGPMGGTVWIGEFEPSELERIDPSQQTRTLHD
jgi:hypothetical protein